MYAGEYCNRDVVIIGKNDTVVKAAKLMRTHHVGDVIVVEIKNGERTPIGILTDRDIVVGVLAEELSLNDVVIADIMSYKLITANEDSDLMATIKRMRINGIRRIPVINAAGGLVGILSVDDILEIITEQLVDIDQIIVNEQKKEHETRTTILHH
jgi:CBS domain-containing protein